MKKISVWKTAVLAVAGMVIAFNSKAQCVNPDVTGSYCSNQYAQYKVTDPDPKVRYHWYEMVGGEYKDRGFGLDGNGKDFVSTGTISGTAPVTNYYYSKETSQTAGPAYRAPTGGSATLITAGKYEMPFETTTDFILNEVTVVVKLSDPAATYGFQIVHNVIETGDTIETFSEWYTAKIADFEPAGLAGFYKVKIPVENIKVKKGPGQSFEFRSVVNAGQNIAVDQVYWWSGAEYNGGDFLGGAIKLKDPQPTATGKTPLIMDWGITTICDPVQATATLSTNCCVPVGSNFSISSSSYFSFPATLTAKGTDLGPGYFYYWFDEDGSPIDNGQDKISVSVPKAGIYSVKVVRNAADINNFSCVGRKTIQIENKLIYTFKDTTVCIGTPFILTAAGAEGNYKWSSPDAAASAAIASPNSQSTAVNLTQPGKYKFIVSGDVKLNNIAYDGKFEKYDDRTNYDIRSYPPTFETTYGNTTSDPPGAFVTNNNQFRVDSKIIAWSSNGLTCNDPSFLQKTDPVTGDVISRGKFFYADANTSGTETPYTTDYANKHYMWRLSDQPIKPNTDYEFSMDAADWSAGSGPPEIMLLVNGTPIDIYVNNVKVSNASGYYQFPTSSSCKWFTITGKWNSGSNTTATIAVAEVSKVNSDHEFAMDDITFSSGRGTQYDTVEVTVEDCFTLSAKADSAKVCAGALVNLTAETNGFIEKWESTPGTTEGTTPAVKVYPAGNTTYTVTAKFPVVNLFPNSDFSNGNSGMETTLSTLTPKPYGTEPDGGTYGVIKGNETWLYNTLLKGDHTTGNGFFLLGKVNSGSEKVVFRKTINVTAGKSYGVSFFIANYSKYPANDGPASIELRINGGAAVKSLVNATSDWTGTQYMWTAATSGTVTVELVSPSESKSKVIGLDDVKIGELGMTKVANVSVAARDCNSLTVMAGKTVCIGEPVRLSAQTDGYITKWGPATEVKTPGASPTVYPVANTTYTVEAKFPVKKLFSNSNFNAGNTDLETSPDVAFKTYGSAPGDNEYGVVAGSETWLYYPYYKGTDHTGDPNGKFLLANTQTNAVKTIVKKTFTAVAGDSYAMSFYFANYHEQTQNGAEAKVQVRVNGALVKEGMALADRSWMYLEHVWTASAAGPITVEIVSPAELTNKTRVLALDDLEINGLGLPKTGSVDIVVKDCFSIVAKTDSVCKGDSVRITVETNGLFKGWKVVSGTASVRSPLSDTTWVKPSTLADIEASAEFQLGNLVENGDFESGDTNGFRSGYRYVKSGGINQGDYTIGKTSNPNNASYFFNIYDHTKGDGTGFMLLGDPNSAAGIATYSSVVPVESGKQYAFSAWVASIQAYYQSPPLLQFYANGVPLGKLDSDSLPKWRQFYTTWTSDVTGNVEIKIVNLNTSLTGNDYAIDDIVFAPLYTKAYKDTVTVPPCVVCNKPVSANLIQTRLLATRCAGDTLNLKGEFVNGGRVNASGDLYYAWFKQGTPQASITYNKISPAPSGNGTFQVPVKTFDPVAAADSGKWVLRVEDGTIGNAGCFSEDTVTVEVNPVTVITVQPVSDTVCEGGEIVLSVTATGTPAITYQWQKNNTDTAITTSTLSIPSAKAFHAGSYKVKVKGGCGPELISTEAVTGVNAKPVITTEPADRAPCQGSSVNFNVSSSGTAPLSYSWRKTKAGNTTPLSGANTTTLALTSITPADEAKGTGEGYDVIVSNICGSDTSIKAKLTVTVSETPSVSLRVSDTLICSGDSITLTANGSGGSLQTYTFKDSGGNVIGTAGQTSVSVKAAPNTSQTYTVEMTANSSCLAPVASNNVTSNATNVTVHSPTIPAKLLASLPATSAANPYLICSSSLNLPGEPITQTPYGKNWWSANHGTLPVNDSTATPVLSSITGSGEAVYHYKNGVCPEKKVSFFFSKVGDLTPAAVAINGGKSGNAGKQYLATLDSLHKMPSQTADTLCLNGNYTLTPRQLKSDENGTWTLMSGTSVNFADLTPDVISGVAQSTGATTLKWKVTGPVASCKPDSVIITLVVNDVPADISITGSDRLCEGTDTVFKVNPSSVAFLPVTYNWDAGALPGALRTGNASGDSTRYKFGSDASGSIIQGTVKVTPVNGCGAGNEASKTVAIKLAPRKFLASPADPKDTINGSLEMCATSTGAWFKLNNIQPEVENYKWYWNSDSVSNGYKHDTDTVFVGQQGNWDTTATAEHIISVQLTNHCSAIAEREFNIKPLERRDTVKLTAPERIKVTLVSNKAKDQFCIPEDYVLFTADTVTNYSNLKGKYEFRLNNTTVQSAYSDRYLASKGTLKDGDKVTAIFLPDPLQCVLYADAVSPVVETEGFGYPSAEISGADTICQDKPLGINLEVARSRTGRGSTYDNNRITWYRINNLKDTMAVSEGNFTLNLTKPEESGLYIAKVERSVCKDTSKTVVPKRVRIHEKPVFVFVQDQISVPYTDGAGDVTKMPVLVKPLVADTFTYQQYLPSLWLQNPNDPYTLLKPEREEKDQVYILTMKTGTPENGKGCETFSPIRVIYYLPLNIPNAFTPNGDGLNDLWVIEGIGKFPQTTVKLFNRWGTQIFSDKDGYRSPWDGESNGSPVAAGTYYYVIELKGSIDGTDENRTGSLTIIR